MLGPTDRIRNEDRRSPKAAKHFHPGASLPPSVFVSHPPARRRSAISGSAARRAGLQPDAQRTSHAIRGKVHRKSLGCPDRAPISLSSSPSRSHPHPPLHPPPP